ncbi:MAG TPA: hypothetical protein VFZ96_06365 [Actinomycetota bacterium]|nr:hypothetical protein [Actinomycetota bacterium]
MLGLIIVWPPSGLAHIVASIPPAGGDDEHRYGVMCVTLRPTAGRSMMRPVVARHRPFVMLLAGALLVGTGASAAAQSPSAAPGPRIDGEVSGASAPGGALDVRADVTMPGGWQGLHLVEVSLLDARREIERLTYDVESTRLQIGEDDVLTGTGDEGTGTYVTVRGPDVIVTTGGPYLSIQIRADVVRALPTGTRFRLSATDDSGATAQVSRALTTADGEGGFGWDVVLAAIVGALLVGAFAGNLVASRRRPPPKLSIYGVVQRRLDAAGEAEPRP